MKSFIHGFSRVASTLVAGAVASIAVAGEAQAEFTGPGIYTIRVAQAPTEQVLDIDSTWGNGGRQGQPLLRWGANQGANQKFVVLADRDGYVIRPAHSLLCLDVPGSIPDVGAEIVQWPCTGGANQRFYMTNNGSGVTRIQSALGSRFLYARQEGGRVVLADELQPGEPLLVGMAFEFHRI